MRRLRRSVAANSAQNQELERANRCRSRIFDSLADCVFVFSDETLLRGNEAARHLLEKAAEPEALLQTIRRTRPAPAPSPSDWVEGRDQEGEPLVLRIRCRMPVRLEEGPCLLSVAEDLSWIFESEDALRTLTGRERKRIARDLHDGLSQVLTFLSFQAKALQAGARGTDSESRFAEIGVLAGECAATAGAVVREFEQKKEEKGDFYTE